MDVFLEVEVLLEGFEKKANNGITLLHRDTLFLINDSIQELRQCKLPLFSTVLNY